MDISVDAIKGMWKQQAGAAKIVWGKLTEDELLKSEGHAEKLAGLVQERYAVTRDDADSQVKAFFDKNTPKGSEKILGVSVDEIKGIWKQQAGSAKIIWGKLTEDELLKSEGHAQKIAGLVQERYAVTRDEAEKQVKDFFDKYNK